MKHVVPSSFDHGSDLGAASSCIAGVLRRVLCRSFRGRDSRDGDGVYEFEIRKEKGKQRKRSEAQRAGSPGIVARLMGIDWRPACPCAPPVAIPRTRSANSVGPWQRTCMIGDESGGHGLPQFRKSKSFREVPTYLRKENEQFLVLSFGTYNDKCNAFDLKAAQTCLCLEQFETKEKSGERKMPTKKRRYGCKGLQIDAEPKECSATDFSEVTQTSTSRGKMPTFGEGVKEIECSSESSSPVSVFDIAIDAEGECLTSPDSTLVREVTREEEKSSRKTVSSIPEMSKTEHAPLKSSDRVPLCRSHKDRSKKSRKFQEAVDRDVSDIWAYISRLEEDNPNRANWVARNLAKVEEAEEIGRVIGLEVIEFLLQETVDEMSYFLLEN